MQARLVHRSLSFCLAAVLTLAMLGGIDHLASPHDAAAPQWAQNTAVRA